MLTRILLLLIGLLSTVHSLPTKNQQETANGVHLDLEKHLDELEIEDVVDDNDERDIILEHSSKEDSSEEDSSEEDSSEEGFNFEKKKGDVGQKMFHGFFSERPLITDRPIIGIVAQELSKSLKKEFGNDTYESYVGASYVKWIEQAGARVVPVMINKPDEYYEGIFNKTNGLVIPGGAASIYMSGYANASRKIFDMALKAFDENDDYYPIWGTCLGFEFLSYITNNNEKNLISCWAQNEAMALNFTQEFKDSYMASKMTEETKQSLSSSKMSVHFHKYCISPDTYHNKSNPYFGDFWNLLATNHDGNGTHFISIIEAKHYPVWGTQYHPEKNAYEWTPRLTGIPHSKKAIRAAAAQAEFFVDEARKNGHRFEGREDEELHLIYNYATEWTGKANVDWVMQQIYLYNSTISHLDSRFRQQIKL